MHWSQTLVVVWCQFVLAAALWLWLARRVLRGTQQPAGGGIRPGVVLGSTDAIAGDPDTRACSPDDVSATIFQQLGFSPQQQVQTPSGRKMPLFRNGAVLGELV